METIQIEEGQTLKDIASEKLGDAGRVFELALLNGISVTDDLVLGGWLWIPQVAVEQLALVKEFAINKTKPASALTETIALDPLDWDVYYGIYD